MNTAADYLAAIVLVIFAIALFLNVKNRTVGQWLRSKFLGVAPGKSGPATPFSAAA